MEYHVIIEKPVSAGIGATIGQHRNLVVRVLSWLHFELSHHAERHRGDRDPDDTDLFRCRRSFLHSGTWFDCEFRVNDVRAEGFLFVETVTVKTRPKS